MPLPLQVHYRGFYASPELREAVVQNAQCLAPFSQIERCVIGVERWYQHHEQGSNYRVTIELDVDGEEISVAEESELTDERSALDAILRSAFEDARSAVVRALATPHAPRPKHSLEARRVHPLHGMAAEDEVVFREPDRGWE